MLIKLILFSAIAGFTIFIGGVLAYFFEKYLRNKNLKIKITHAISAFGAGIILSALSLVLIPRGLEGLETNSMVLSFFAGTIIFYFLNKRISQTRGSTAALMAMMMDFIPESIALGAVFFVDPTAAMLLALFIGLQNIPEAFTAFAELKNSGVKVKKILTVFFFLSFSGVISALLGHYTLGENPEVTAIVMVFAAGGILYLLFQDIIPNTKLKGSYHTELYASLGFLVGIIGEKIL
jgi:ZIP family zinc transporter